MNSERERVFDLRTVQRHIRAEHVSKEEYDAYLKSLEDVSHKILEPSEGGDDDGFDGTKPAAPAVAAPVAAAAAPAVAAPDPAPLDDGWGISSDAPPAPVAPVVPAGSDSNE